MIRHLLHGLNEEQLRAVTTDHPRVLTIAPAGSGKTKCLTLRVVRLMAKGCPGERILCVTFTRAAAAEMRERIQDALVEAGLGSHVTLPTIRTLHSWGASLIRRYASFFGLTRDFSIYDEIDRADVIRSCARDVGLDKWDRSKIQTLWKNSRVQALYRDRMRQSNAVDYDQIEDMTLKLLASHPEVADRWIKYFRHVMVDEYQDTNLAQVLIVNALVAGSIYIVGDPRQGIYRFRGAEPKTIIEHANDADFEVVHLLKNYRSVPECIEVSNRCVLGEWPPMVAGRGLQHQRHETRSVQESDPEMQSVFSLDRVVALFCDNEADAITRAIRAGAERGYGYGEIAVLARTWSTLRTVRDRLAKEKIPFCFHGDDDDPWATSDGRQLARFLMLMANPADDNMASFVADWGCVGRTRFDDLRRLRSAALTQRAPLSVVMCETNEEWRRLGRWKYTDTHNAFEVACAGIASLEVVDTYRKHELTTRADTLDALVDDIGRRGLTIDGFRDWWVGRTTAEKIRESRDKKSVQLMTIHASKGLEYPLVILADCRTGVFPSDRATTTDDDRAEDMRLLYVALTRARDRIVVTCPSTYKAPWWNEPQPTAPAPFFLQAIAPRGFTEWSPS